MQQMCNADDQQFEDVSDLELGIIRILVPSIKKIVEDNLDETVFAEGQTNVLLQPEFFNREQIGVVIEIVEEKRLLMHLLKHHKREKDIDLHWWRDSRRNLQSFSIIKTNYRVGNLMGSLGVIGPKRMPYPFLVSAVEYTAKVLGELHS